MDSGTAIIIGDNKSGGPEWNICGAQNLQIEEESCSEMCKNEKSRCL